MSRPIKDTPVLTGKDAERFEAAIQFHESNPVHPGEYDRIMDSYRRFEVVEGDSDES